MDRLLERLQEVQGSAVSGSATAGAQAQLLGEGELTGDASSIVTATATLAMQGAAGAITSATGTAEGAGALTGRADTIAGALGTALAKGSLAGVAVSIAGASMTPTVAGTASAAAGATGEVEDVGAALVGTSSAVTGATGIVIALGVLAGTADATGNASATPYTPGYQPNNPLLYSACIQGVVAANGAYVNPKGTNVSLAMSISQATLIAETVDKLIPPDDTITSGGATLAPITGAIQTAELFKLGAMESISYAALTTQANTAEIPEIVVDVLARGIALKYLAVILAPGLMLMRGMSSDEGPKYVHQPAKAKASKRR